MWKRADGHIDDEALIALLDGELSRRSERSVSGHLKACWQCRVRLARMEEAIRRLAEARECRSFPGPGRIDRERRQFFARFDKLAAEIADRTSLLRRGGNAPVFGRFFSLPGWVAVSAAFFLAVGAFTIWTLQPRQPDAAAVLRAARVEASGDPSASGTSIHQAFRVEIVTSGAPASIDQSRLEVWSHSASRRFASRWTGSEASLRHAVWRSGAGLSYAYDPISESSAAEQGELPLQVLTLADLGRDGFELQRFQRRFAQWLGSHSWRPISLADDLAAFSNEAGVTLAAERVSSPRGGVIRIKVRGTRDGANITLVLELDSTSYQICRLIARFEEKDRAVEVRFIPERTDLVAPARLPAGIFEPDAVLTKHDRKQKQRRTEAMHPPVTPRPDPHLTGSRARGAPDMTRLELEAYFALHVARACLGEPVEIVREPSGGLAVRGTVTGAERKAELLAALSPLDSQGWLHVDIQTIEEAMHARALLQGLPSGVPAGMQLSDAGSSGAPVRILSERLPLQARIEQYLGAREKSPAAERIRSFSEFAGRAVLLSEQALREAWAMRRLIEGFATFNSNDPDVRARQLLVRMLRDHLAAVDIAHAAVHEWVEPALSKALGLELACRASRWESPERGTDGGRDALLKVFETANRIHRNVLNLFAGADLPAVATSDSSAPERSPPPEESGRELLELLCQAAAEADESVVWIDRWSKSENAAISEVKK